jgi:hypothetical protein
MIDEKDYSKFSKEQYDNIKRKTSCSVTLKELQKKYVAEGKISRRNGTYRYMPVRRKEFMEEVGKKFNEIKLKVNEEITIGDLTLKKIAEEYERQRKNDHEKIWTTTVPPKYSLISKVRNYEQQPLNKIKEIIKEKMRHSNCVITVLNAENKENIIWDNKSTTWTIPKKLWNIIVISLNSNQIILISAKSFDNDHSWIRIYKENEIFKEQRGYEGRMDTIEHVINENYYYVLSQIKCREAINKILLINSFIQSNEITTMVAKYLNVVVDEDDTDEEKEDNNDKSDEEDDTVESDESDESDDE